MNNRLFAFFSLLALLFLSHHVFGQTPADYTLDPGKLITQYIHNVWQSEDGLPQNTVTSIVQTQDGYLWLGTLEGLVRFDGVQFTVFDKQNTPALKSNRVWSLCEDRHLSLWIGTENGGLARLHNGTFTSFDTAAGLLSNTVYEIYEDRKGNLWVGTAQGLNIEHENRFVEFSARNKLPRKSVWDICEDFQGTLWFGGAGVFSLENGRFVEHRIGSFDINSVWAIKFDAKDNLWVGSDAGLLKYKQGKASRVRLSDPERNSIRALFIDLKGCLWVGTENKGLFRLNAGRLASYSLNDGLSNNSVYTFLQDREGSLWVGTNGGGLNQFHDGKFTSYTTSEGLANNFVWSICEDKGRNLWFGTYDGLSRFSDGIMKTYSVRDGLKNTFVWSIFQDRQGSLWLGTSGGLVLFDGSSFKTYEIVRGRTDNVVRAILEDGRGNLWVGSSDDGLSLFHDGKFRSYTVSDGLANNSVRALLEDREGGIWVGTMSGLSFFRHGKFKTYSVNDGLSSDIIRSLYQDKEGTLWIGTEGGGLNQFRNGRFTSFTQRDGLFDDVVSQILEDDEQNLWMSCNKGIFRISKTELNNFAEGRIQRIICVSFGTADGMKSQECNGGSQPAGWKSVDGSLWFPTVKGAVMIDPGNIRVNKQPPQVLIEEVVIDSDIYTEPKRINARAGAEKFEFHYTALSFIAPERMQFKYKLEGVDKGWVFAGNRRVAYYTNIPPGDYVFRVIAANSDDVWNLEGASAIVYHEPFFFQRRVFQVIAALGVGVFAFGIYLARVRALQSRERALTKLVDERTKDLFEQTKIAQEANKFKSQLLSLAAHDLKSPLISIRGFVRLLREELDKAPESAEKADLIQRLSQNMLSLINELLESAELESGKIQLIKHPVDVSLLALAVTDLNKQLVERKNQRFLLSLDNSGRCIVHADANRLQEAMENLVTNAIKYSPPGKEILVSVQRKSSTVLFSVQDEGPGITDDDMPRLFERFQRLSSRPTGDETSSGLGLYIVKQIVDFHGGRVWAETESGKGSTFKIELTAAETLQVEKNIT